MYTEFRDADGETVKVQRSSSVGRRLVYIFPAAKIHLGEAISGAHLTVPMAKRVIKALRSEEHTSELQSLTNLVCRLLLEKKKKKKNRKKKNKQNISK